MSTPPTSPVAICNLALSRLGQRAISSLTAPVNPAGDNCALWYDETRQELLRAYIFPFSVKQAQLTPDASVTPVFGWTNAYKLPADYLRFMRASDGNEYSGMVPTWYYSLVGNHIYCDEFNTQQNPVAGGAPISGLNIWYVGDVTTVPSWDSLFKKCMRLQLAMNMAYAFTLKQSLRKEIESELEDALLEAAAIAGQEKPPVRVQRSRLVEVRRRGGVFRNYSRY
ncbi:MAG: hypothetical protein KGJ13_02420 [Patescibacteria group bacterium]|nr:hypothetical protein [Patescibacteria group bacterium]